MATNGEASTSQPKITLYTNHGCPYAHRVHIAIKELGLKYEEVIIDLETPREEWYLKINPRGLVPALKYNDELITESAVITQFLVDAHPSHLVPASNASPPDGALARARISFFADTYTSKIQPVMFRAFQAIGASDDEGVKKCLDEMLVTLKKEIEPQLEQETSGGKFFRGSEKLTLAECLTAGFVVRWYAYARGGLVPREFLDGLAELKNFSRWSQALTEHESVKYVFDEKKTVEGTKRMIEKKFGRKM
ncbi:MAG: hypothetical protein M1816_008076 [Peltula sp. TS41687]|nr:MAG: hypothetical protein M1816_008076 [Peltula sp. TS41687]